MAMTAMSNPQVATALVTGGARRIGRVIVEALAERGFAVAIHCHRAGEEAERLATAIARSGGRAAVIAADLSEPADADALVARAAGQLGPIRLVVNNASLFLPDTATDFSWKTWDDHFALHVKAPAALARGLAAQLPEGATGLVVNMIDQRVLKPTPQFFSYALSKATLLAATQTMAQALAPRIRVNAIGPGPTMPNDRQRPEDFAAQTDALILGRGPQPREIADTILYLWDAPSVTGQMIAVDGGQHLAWRTPDVTGMRE